MRGEGGKADPYENGKFSCLLDCFWHPDGTENRSKRVAGTTVSAALFCGMKGRKTDEGYL